jgi:DMSO/TMAO reductase YedYZ molybdopterin-dependent catalytic subunit
MNTRYIGLTIKEHFNFLISILFFASSYLTPNCYALDPPPITPIDEFFVQNSSGIPPVPGDWHLTVEGAVETPLSLTLADLMIYPETTLMATLECYHTSEVLIGNANWTGVSFQTILDEAGPLGEAQSISICALDGYCMHGLSLDDFLQRDDILLAYDMNEETLPPEQGYPLRLVLPGSYGYQWMQWVDSIELTTTSPTLPLKLFPARAKTFEPKGGDTISRGTHTISGMAFGGGGIEIVKVDISTDDGETWEPAQLLNYFVPDVWKFWEFEWVIPQDGEYEIFARAEDDLGNVQEETFGIFGWHVLGIDVSVSTCEGDFESDGDVDGTDAVAFKQDFFRKDCAEPTPCNGDFECDGDVDGTDAVMFKEDFFRKDCPSYEFTCSYE